MTYLPWVYRVCHVMYCPDVLYALSLTSWYQVDRGESHWIAVKDILKYFRRTKNTFLIYGGEEELSVKGYINASFQTDKDDSLSQSSFVFGPNGGAVSWKSSKEDTVVDYTTKAKYITTSKAAKEVVWISYTMKTDVGYATMYVVEDD
ncbi:secreted RxLR effector protein 161-like [Gossypium raimondii]|uniref:secreted RxLR effector protein 161-like n=1 Tax=Gossypium raimondii TaxID=29730 RepID=UPI00227B404A|nr:secreted RxLR effector protein 161-like [Gossypium raimondii]